MKPLNRILIAGVGALAPALLVLYKMDHNALYQTADMAVIFGGSLKGGLAFVFGGIIGYLYEEEHKPVKLFQLGIAAPAILSIMVAGQGQSGPTDRHIETEPASAEVIQDTEPDQDLGLIDMFFPSAMAQEMPTKLNSVDQIGSFTLPEETISQKVWRGFTGTLPDNRFYVASEPEDFDEAKKLRDQLVESGLQDAKLFRSSRLDGTYRVVLGEHMKISDAEKMSDQLKKDGKLKTTLVEVKK